MTEQRQQLIIDEEEHEYKYTNYETEKEPRFGTVSYQVAGGGMMNGNAYATIELKDEIYCYCEYGKNASRRPVGNKIVWSDEIFDKKEPYESRSFDIIDEEEEEEEEEVLCDDCGEEDCSMDGLCCPEAIERTENNTVCDCCDRKLVVDVADPKYFPYYNFHSKRLDNCLACGVCYFDAGYWKDDENADNKDAIDEYAQ